MDASVSLNVNLNLSPIWHQWKIVTIRWNVPFSISSAVKSVTGRGIVLVAWMKYTSIFIHACSPSKVVTWHEHWRYWYWRWNCRNIEQPYNLQQRLESDACDTKTLGIVVSFCFGGICRTCVWWLNVGVKSCDFVWWLICSCTYTQKGDHRSRTWRFLFRTEGCFQGRRRRGGGGRDLPPTLCKIGRVDPSRTSVIL